MKWKIIPIILLAVASLALTPAERQFAERARTYVQQAKQKALEQQKVIEETDRENQKLDQLTLGQQNQIVNLSGQIDRSHNNEVELGKYNAYAKPIIEQVNKYWGLGAFAYGFKVLARHLLILVAVLIVIALILFGLSFAFPALGAFLRTAGAFLAAIIRRIGDIFRKK